MRLLGTQGENPHRDGRIGIDSVAGHRKALSNKASSGCECVRVRVRVSLLDLCKEVVLPHPCLYEITDQSLLEHTWQACV